MYHWYKSRIRTSGQYNERGIFETRNFFVQSLFAKNIIFIYLQVSKVRGNAKIMQIIRNNYYGFIITNCILLKNTVINHKELEKSLKTRQKKALVLSQDIKKIGLDRIM